MRQAGIGWGFALLFCVLFWALVFLGFTQRAHAERYCVRHVDVWRHGSCNAEWGFTCRRGHWARVCIQWTYRDYDRPERVYGYGYERRWEDRGAKCDDPVRAVGVEKYGNGNAKGSADAQWAETVRARIGGMYMDLKNARDVTYECWQSSTGNRKSEKVAEGLTGGAGVLEQCEIRAVPCRAPKTQGGPNE